MPGVHSMTAFASLSRAMLLGFVRDRTALFFVIFFPLLFLFLFGGVFKDQGASKVDVVQVGEVSVIDSLPAGAKTEIGRILKITRSDDLDDAREKVRKGDYAAVVTQQGDRVVVDYSAADQVRSGTVRTTLQSVVDGQNSAGRPPKYTLASNQVEDESLKAIQYVTPGLLGWAIATSATFGAATTLVAWRQKKILRRLRLSPVSTSSVVFARVGVSLGIALGQAAIFIGIALLPYFGLQLDQYWWMAVPLLICGTLAFLAIGLLAGAFAKTAEGASGIANLIVLPMAFLSGSFIPLDAAPGWLKTVSQVLPLRHLNDAMLDVMVRGQSPVSVLPEMGILLGFAAVIGLIAVRVFQWDDV